MAITLDGTNGINSSGVIVAPDGSASAPAITNDGDTNTGIFFPAADTIAFAEGGAEAMRIDSSGNVGIGVTPSAWSGSVKAMQIGAGGSLMGAGADLYLGNNYYFNGSNNIYISNGTATQYAMSGGQHKFYTASSGTAGNAISFTQAMTLDSSGNLLVGTTTASGKLTSVTASTTTAAGYFITPASFTGSNLISLSSTASGTGWDHLICYSNVGGTTNLRILGNGNVQNANNSYGALSDIKLKENIVDATPKLDDLMQVQVRHYNFIGDEQKQLGVIAQELEQIFPGMVEESPDRDAEGNDLGTTTKSVKYSVFVPMLIKAIQELSAKNDALEARIAALEGSQT
jgi:hypothetical protein